MIKVKHPVENCNNSQTELVANLPEDKRHSQELFFNYGNAAYRYHAQANEYKPTLTDFEEWLQGLPANIRADMQTRGFDYCQTTIPFTRYVNEKNDFGMEEYIKSLMGEDLYTEYRKTIKE